MTSHGSDDEFEWFELGSETSRRLPANLAEATGDMTTTEREIAALWRLEADVHNGGFVQFFCNWGPTQTRMRRTGVRLTA